MAYEYDIPHVDFVREFHENDGADAFFDIHEQLENKLNSNMPEEESKSSASDVSSADRESNDTASTSEICPPDVGQRDHTVFKVITESTQNIQVLQESRKRKSDVDHRSVKFISLVEGVPGFQGHMRGTYRTHAHGIKGKKKDNFSHRCHVTVPQSPLLLSKMRSRPVDYPSAEERTQKEVEEILAFKLKANPVNKKIFEPPQLGRRIARAPTVVEPFNLTEYKKGIRNSSETFHFKANPVPKGMLQHSPFHTNVPIPKLLARTSPCPFSFEERDRMMLKHKEEKIQRRKELEDKRQEEEVLRLRQQAVHKAQPIRSYKPIPLQQNIPVTFPVTPKFSDRTKK